MKHVPEILMIVAGIIITTIVISYGFRLLNPATKAANAVAEDTNAINRNISERKITKYVESDVTGSDVISAARELKESITITVVRLVGGNVVFSSSSAAIKNLPTDVNYVNPTGTFRGEVIHKNNKKSDVIIELKFTQIQ